MNVWRGKVLAEVPFGHVLIAGGKIKPNPNKICFDLSENFPDKSGHGTILLKIEANFRENQIIRSMYLPGAGWCQEEISKNWKNGTPKNPLVAGQNFTFRVAVLQKCYEIYVNDKLYGTFEHLQSPRMINYVIVSGDYERITQFHHRMLFPLVFPKTILSSEKECFASDVPKKYEVGTTVVLEAIAKGPPTSEFSICFQCNETGRVFFKFLVNFNTKTVVRTSQRNNLLFHSDDEETCGEFPFKRGKTFKIAFGLGEKAFHVAVNGNFLAFYNFPFEPFALSTVKCYTNNVGDLTVTGLEYYSDSPLLNHLEDYSRT